MPGYKNTHEATQVIRCKACAVVVKQVPVEYLDTQEQLLHVALASPRTFDSTIAFCWCDDPEAVCRALVSAVEACPPAHLVPATLAFTMSSPEAGQGGGLGIWNVCRRDKGVIN